MNFFKHPYVLRRYSEPIWTHGYSSIPYNDTTVSMGIQTISDDIVTSPDGTVSVQRIKVFCDEEIFVENTEKQQKADRIFFQGKWFECKSSRLSENTPLKHYTATFVELLDNEEMPQSDGEEDLVDESERS